MAAARSGQEAIFLELVKAGADVHATNELGSSVLQEAAGERGTRAMVQAVLADGIQPSDGLADALVFASADGTVEVVKALIAAGADVNAMGELGHAPLLAAVERNKPNNVAVLLKAGARTDVRVPRSDLGDNKHYKKTALELALAEGYGRIVELLKAAGAVKTPKPRQPRMPSTTAASWERLARWLTENAPGWKPLKKGASGQQIDRAEAKLGFALPADLRDSYRLHNGSGEAQIFPCADDISYYWMPLSELVREWAMMTELLEGGEFTANAGATEKGIRQEWWNIRWVPFASNGGGDYFCVDLAPAAGGKRGQIITMNHESGEHKRLAFSFRE